MLSFFKRKNKESDTNSDKRKKLLLMGDISDELIKPIIEELFRLQEEDFEGSVDLYISSTGGYVGSALSLITVMDSINDSPNYKFKVNTVALREIYSSAFYIWVSGYTSATTSFSEGLIHSSFGSTEGSENQIKDYLTQTQRENEIIADLLLRRTTLDRDTIEKMIGDSRDHYFTDSELRRLVAIPRKLPDSYGDIDIDNLVRRANLK